MKKTGLLLVLLSNARELLVPQKQVELFKVFTHFMRKGEQVQGRILAGGGGGHQNKKKKTSKAHGKKSKKGHKPGSTSSDIGPHGHDGEHKDGEIINDAASAFAEIAVAFIGITYSLFFLLTALGYCIRSYKKTQYVSQISLMNAVGGFDDPTAFKSTEDKLVEEMISHQEKKPNKQRGILPVQATLGSQYQTFEKQNSLRDQVRQNSYLESDEDEVSPELLPEY